MKLLVRRSDGGNPATRMPLPEPRRSARGSRVRVGDPSAEAFDEWAGAAIVGFRPPPSRNRHACPTGDLPGADARRIRLRRGGGHREVPSATWGSPTCMRRPTSRRARGVPTATTSWIIRCPTPNWAGLEAHGSALLRAGRGGPGPDPGHRPQPHEHRQPRQQAWWWDVLENGQSSRYAAYFDVDWQPRLRRSSATPS